MTYSAQSPLNGHGQASASAIATWFWGSNHQLDGTLAIEIGDAVLAEAQAAGLNSDLVAAQIAHETGYWSSAYAMQRNNPAGLGAVNDNPDLALSFPTVRAGIHAMCAHLLSYELGAGNPWRADDPRYAETQAAGYLGIATVLSDLDRRWAWPGVGYGAAVARLANELLASQERNMPGDIWPTSEQIGWPVTVQKADADIGPARALADIRWYVIHDTEGSRAGDLQILEHADPAQASVHFWISKQGEVVAIVPITYTSWTVANQAVDTVAVNFEQEGHATEQRSEQQYRALAALIRWCRGQGVPVPIEYVGRQEKPGIIGHMDVANPNQPGAFGGASGHTDPGPLYDFGKLVSYVGQEVPQQMVTPGNSRIFAGVAFAIHDGFKVYWEKLDADGFALLALGYPTSDEVSVTLGDVTRTMQRFERGALIYEPQNPSPWDVHHATLEQIAALDATLGGQG